MSGVLNFSSPSIFLSLSFFAFPPFRGLSSALITYRVVLLAVVVVQLVLLVPDQALGWMIKSSVLWQGKADTVAAA
jgi:hypothetical protein